MPHSLTRRAAACAAAVYGTVVLAACGGRRPEARLLIPPPAQPPDTVTIVADERLLADPRVWQSDGTPVLVVRAAAGLDARDLLDGGADLLLTDDPAALAYAATLPEFRAIPLDWDRTYVLVAPAAVTIDSVHRAELARDAVRVEARPAEPPYWWDERRCASAAAAPAPVPAPVPAPPVAAAARIVYVRGDRIAGDIAARLAAQRIGGSAAAGISAEDFAASLHAGRDAGYVFPLPRRPPPECAAMPSLPAGAGVVPLIDTRRRAVVREGTVGLSVDTDGRLRLEPR